ncbi:MAG TPA: LptE family protein [Gemmatimonadales bacterium]|nr:LptE family protein [Gemmatimonadales bacterium]
MSSRWWRSIRWRCWPRLCGAAAVSFSGLWLAGCIYGFAGGTLPNVKTVAILPFDNDTPEPALTQEVSEAVRQAFEGRLGLRVAPEATADALVRGRIARYDPDVPIALLPGQGEVTVTKRKVQLAVDVEILNQREGTTVWKRQVLVDGEYNPGREREGRRIALDKLVNEIVDGAQSQW